MELQDLAVDGRAVALGTRTASLRFSWRFGSVEPDRAAAGDGVDRDPGAAVDSAPARGHAQDWWSIRVRADGAVVWDSGRTQDTTPWAVSPPDVSFAPWHEHTWELRVGAGTHVRSAVGVFTPAPVAEPDWHGARWIGRAAVGADPAETRSPRERCHDGSLAAPVVATSVVPVRPVRRALLALAAGGHADVLVDGELATDEVLSPSTTHWDRHVEVVLHDLTAAFAAASDERECQLSLELGRGFHGMTNENVWHWERAPWHAEPSVRATLRLEHDDGSVSVRTTGPDWTMRPGPRLLDDLYGGEVVDLRRRPGGGQPPPTEPAAVVAGPSGRLQARREQPARVVETLAPTGVSEPVPGTFVVAFPRVVAGWVRLRLPAAGRGDTVTVRYGERLRPDGLPNADDDNHYFADGFQTDEVTLDGRAGGWEPRFSYKGFRFVSVTGWPVAGGPTAEDLVACVVHTDAARTSTFTVDDPLLQWMHDATVHTMANNLHGYPTDTPKYEKNGWTGDAAVGADMFLTDLDAAPVLVKWVQDLAETVRPGSPPDLIAPNAGVYGADTRAPVWHSALVTVPWDVYRHTGDDTVLTRHWDVIEGYARLELERSTGGIADTILGDWVAPGTDPGGGNPPEDSRVPATAFLVRILDTTAAIGRVIGRDAAWAADAAEEVRAAFVDAFVAGPVVESAPGPSRAFASTSESAPDPAPVQASTAPDPAPVQASTAPDPAPVQASTAPDPAPVQASSAPDPAPVQASSAPDPASAPTTASVPAPVVRGPGDAGFRQSHHVLALAFDIVRDPSLRRRIADALAADVRARGDHLDTGAIGTKWLLPVLSDSGHADLAMAVARQTTPPSWGAWWAAGATSTFEHWDLAARSHGHYFLGTVDDWLTGWVAGIRPTAPGWQRFRVAPAVTAWVGSASCSVLTPFGRASSAWRVVDAVCTLDVEVPFGATADVRTPDGREHRAGPGRHRFRTPVTVQER